MSTFKVHEPMDVQIVATEHGDGPSFQPGPNWSELDMLRWHAGVVEARCGVRIKITTGGVTRNGKEVRGVFGYASQYSGGGSMDYREMWCWLNGVEMGAQARLREAADA